MCVCNVFVPSCTVCRLLPEMITCANATRVRLHNHPALYIIVYVIVYNRTCGHPTPAAPTVCCLCSRPRLPFQRTINRSVQQARFECCGAAHLPCPAIARGGARRARRSPPQSRSCRMRAGCALVCAAVCARAQHLGRVLHELHAVVRQNAPLHLACWVRGCHTSSGGEKAGGGATSSQRCKRRQSHPAPLDVFESIDAASWFVEGRVIGGRWNGEWRWTCFGEDDPAKFIHLDSQGKIS